MRVFDFDNTIYDGESGFDIFAYFLKKDPKGLAKYAPKFLECFIKYKRQKITVEEVLNDYGLFLKEYCGRIPDIYGEFEKFWDLNQGNIKSFYYDIQDEGDIIVSACPLCLLQIMCDRLGIKNVIGSDLNPITGEIHNICYKERKVTAFREKYGDVTIDEFYTDSMSDKPMMDISKNVFLVNGNKIMLIKKDGKYLDY